MRRIDESANQRLLLPTSHCLAAVYIRIFAFAQRLEDWPRRCVDGYAAKRTREVNACTLKGRIEFFETIKPNRATLYPR